MRGNTSLSFSQHGAIESSFETEKVTMSSVEIDKHQVNSFVLIHCFNFLCSFVYCGWVEVGVPAHIHVYSWVTVHVEVKGQPVRVGVLSPCGT